jgi:putative DNA primase/helicase
MHASAGTIQERMNEASRLSSLAAMPPLLYERMRKETAKRLNIRPSALDTLVQSLRPATGDENAQGTVISFAPIEPWLDSVDGTTLVADMMEAITTHVVMSKHQALAIALWILHAHAIEAAEHSPRLQFESPTMRCGKSTALRVIKPMVPKPLGTENITTAALFRIIELCQPTLLIDEADSFLKREDGKDNEELRGIMNGGHYRGGMVIRTVGDNHEPKGFAVFAPVAFAWLVRHGRHVSDTLADRSITIELRRRKPEERITRLRANRTDHLKTLGRRAARWVADHVQALRNADPTLPEELGDRAQDNWRLLIVIADAISTDLGQEARKAAVKNEEERIGGDEDAAILALGDVAALMAMRVKTHREQRLPPLEAVSSLTLTDDLCNLEDRPWKEWRRGHPLTQNSLARLLRPFGLKPKMVRFNAQEVARAYLIAEVEEAAARYVERQETRNEDEVGM